MEFIQESNIYGCGFVLFGVWFCLLQSWLSDDSVSGGSCSLWVHVMFSLFLASNEHPKPLWTSLDPIGITFSRNSSYFSLYFSLSTFLFPKTLYKQYRRICLHAFACTYGIPHWMWNHFLGAKDENENNVIQQQP